MLEFSKPLTKALGVIFFIQFYILCSAMARLGGSALPLVDSCHGGDHLKELLLQAAVGVNWPVVSLW